MEFFVITRDQKMLEEKHREELLKSANFESNSKRDHVLYLEDQSELRHTNRMRNMNNGNTFFLKIINKLKWVYVTIIPTQTYNNVTYQNDAYQNNTYQNDTYLRF